jgi:DNA segregation ATPase FtsK/SpoIIIE-like protein
MNMFQKLLALASQTADYEIPLQQGVNWNLRRSPHGIISGNSGGGKSFAVLYLLIILSIKQNTLFLADPKESDMSSLAEFMPPNRVASEEDDILAMASEVREIMKQRYKYMKSERVRKGLFQKDYVDFGYSAVIFVIEEMADFVSSLDKKNRENFDKIIKSITMKGRQSGVFLCSIMQSPNTNNISSESRSQMGLRVYLGMSGGIEYRMLFGEGFTYPKRTFNAGQGLYMLSGKTPAPEVIEMPRLDEKQLGETLKSALEIQHDLNPLTIIML